MHDTIIQPRFAFEREYWNKRYLNHDPRGSGGGSYGEPMWHKADALAALPDVKSIVEIGSGDFNFGKHLTSILPTVKYDGYDISDAVIDRSRRLFSTSDQRIQFSDMPPLDEFLPQSDLLLCIDVLFHIIDDAEYRAMLRYLHRNWWKYLALTAYEYDGPSDGHVRIRKFDPSMFGTPILQETIEEPGSLQFYIFKR